MIALRFLAWAAPSAALVAILVVSELARAIAALVTLKIVLAVMP